MLPNTLKPVATIAKHTYRELIRERILYGILLTAALVTAFSFFLSTVSLGQDVRITQNIGLSAIKFFTVFIAIFVTTTTVARDLEKRTVYFLFPKPISRGQYVAGKYAGLVLLLATILAILGGVFMLGLVFTARSVIMPALINLVFTFFEASLLIALAQMLASFTAPLNAALYSLAFTVIGHSLTALRDFLSAQGASFALHLVNICYFFLPNLEKFDVSGATLLGIPLGFGHVFWTIFYWFIYTALLLFLSSRIIHKREF